MLAFSKYTDLEKKKPKIEDEEATEHYGNDKYKMSTNTDSVSDDIVLEKPLKQSKEQQIGPYEQKQEDKSFKDVPKSNPLGDRDNTAFFGSISAVELALLNLVIGNGVSNRLNN